MEAFSSKVHRLLKFLMEIQIKPGSSSTAVWQRHGDHAGFPISMAQLVGPHSINLLHFLLGLRRAEWNIEPA